jgi:hypothetical protein
VPPFGIRVRVIMKNVLDLGAAMIFFKGMEQAENLLTNLGLN